MKKKIKNTTRLEQIENLIKKIVERRKSITLKENTIYEKKS